MNDNANEARAQDVMTQDPVCVTPATTLRELAEIFRDNEFSGAPVVDAQGALVGVVTKSDLLKHALESSAAPAYLFEIVAEQADDRDREAGFEPETDVHVEDIMTEDPLTAASGTPVHVIARLMSEHRVHRLIIVDPERTPVGIVTSLDLLGVFPGRPTR